MAHFGRKDFLLDRWGGVIWPLKINEKPFNRHAYDTMVAWCLEQSMEFACKREKEFYFGDETNICMFKMKWM